MSESDRLFEAAGENPLNELRKLYSEEVIDHILNPRNLGYIENSDGYAILSRTCGDTLQIFIKVHDDVIVEVRFLTNGCGSVIACGSVSTTMIKGKNIIDALRITQYNIMDSLDGLPETESHCALLAANTIHSAIRDYLSLKKEPWKKAYRRIEPL
jgi:nitrogen fixation NifU-like protein